MCPSRSPFCDCFKPKCPPTRLALLRTSILPWTLCCKSPDQLLYGNQSLHHKAEGNISSRRPVLCLPLLTVYRPLPLFCAYRLQVLPFTVS